jgi:hypothetical protein
MPDRNRNNRHVSVRMPEDLYAAIKEVADEHKVSVGWAIRSALENAFMGNNRPRRTERPASTRITNSADTSGAANFLQAHNSGGM